MSTNGAVMQEAAVVPAAKPQMEHSRGHFNAMLLLLLLLSSFSRVRLCATPEMAAHQAPPSLGFSRKEHWNSVHNPSAIPTDLKFKVYPEVNHFFTVAIHPQISLRFFQYTWN